MDLSREKPTKHLIDARTPQGEWEHEGEVAQVRKTAKYKKWRAQVDAIENKTGKRRRLNAAERKSYDPPGPIEKHYKVWVNAEEKQDLLLGSGRKKPLPLLGLPAYPPISSSGSGPSVGPGTSRTSTSSVGSSKMGSSSTQSGGLKSSTGPVSGASRSTAGKTSGGSTTGGNQSRDSTRSANSLGPGTYGGNASRDSTRSANSLGPDTYGGNPSRDTRASANSLGPDRYGGNQGGRESLASLGGRNLGGNATPTGPRGPLGPSNSDMRQPLGALAAALRGPSPSILGSYSGPKGSPLLGLNPAAQKANVNWSGEEPDSNAFDPLTGVNPAISRNPFDVLTDVGRVQKVNGNLTGEFGPQAEIGSGRFGLPMDLGMPGLQNAAFSPPDKQATQYQPRDPLNTMPGSEASIRNITDLTGAPRLAEAARQRQASLGAVLADRYGLSDPAAIDMVGKMARTTAGETMGLSPAEQAAAAHTMFNRMDLSKAYPEQFGLGWDPASVLSAYDANGIRRGTTTNRAFIGAKPGTQSYADALNAVANAASPTGSYLSAPQAVQDATHYLNPDTAGRKALSGWAKEGGTPFGAHTFYSPDSTAAQLAEARGIAPPQQTAENDPAVGIATAFSGLAPKPRPKPERPLLSAPQTMVAGRPDVPVSTNYMATRAPTPFTPTSLMGDYVAPDPQMAKQDKGAVPTPSGYRPWEGSYVRPEFSALGGMPAAPAPEVADNYRPWEGSYTRPEFSGLGGFPAAASPVPPGSYRPWEGSYTRPEFSGLGGFPAATAPGIASLIGTPPTPQRAPYKRGEPIDYPGTVVEKNQSVEDPFRSLNIAQNPFDTEYADFAPSLEARRAMATNQKLAEARAIQDLQNPDVGDQWSDLREFEQDARRELYGPSGVPTLTGPSMPDVSRAMAGPGAYDDPENRTTINQTQPKNIPPAASPAVVNALRERLQDLAAQGVPVFHEYRPDLPGGRLPQTAATQPRTSNPPRSYPPARFDYVTPPGSIGTAKKKIEQGQRLQTSKANQRRNDFRGVGSRGELKAEQVAALVNRIRQRLQERPTIAQPPATPPAPEPPIYPTSIAFPQYTQQWAFQGGPFG